ncbi:ABC transporter substrate-binding protein [Psychrobacter urativorans]|uniref:ABC transporter substrate-binding protein n=1 Tax=Psychrobacter urativorans TaxID=45610 RepID=UPI00191B79FE|nr:ABC transporter substrate-binding protein [Psychrobacter urativorans]
MKRIFTLTLAMLLAGCSQNPVEGDPAKTTEGDTATTSLPVNGVTDDEVLIGGMLDLSGPFAAFSVPAVAAANQYFETVNAAGGVHGRKIRYIVEDHAYQVPKAVQAANKLVTRDKVFAMLLNVGTAHNMAAFPVLDNNDVPNVIPLSLAMPMQTEGDFSRRFTIGSTYYQTMKAGMKYIIEKENVTKLCTMYFPSDFGEETHQAAKELAAEINTLELVEVSTHRPDETDMSGTLAKMREADCGLVAVALTVRPSIGVVATAKSMGWDEAKFIVPISSFHSAVSGAPGGITEGLYAVSLWEDLDILKANPKTAEWIANYKKANGEEPNTGAAIGYLGAKILVEGLEAAGPTLNADSLAKGIETVNIDDDVINAHIGMSADNHAAVTQAYLSQVVDSQWQTVAKIIE